ncbi:hypothetical protein HER10_EVM0001222 [Colletotrichum scovillei]|uniref:uncharacterized protein n=1 Tax=Colletotrichum scovillei TaxID=1209932 RepID=UPI0015C2E32F|nr:uncharacterized protein HER10_EVM0001222 [Colletotrichum scovillei]KAF4779126.1 hypothetical protein HER10_EVM0001222 [Colletotrichum scovillei]
MASEQLNELSDRIAEAARKGMARKSFFSFGDEGLTASVGATGRLLRITQHFPGLKTGICVDDEKTEEPYYVFWRLSQFLERSLDGNSGGIGPRIDSLCPGGESKQNIINDRWPTFTITTPGDTSNKLHVSYVAFQGTVYQKFEIIDKNEEQSSRPKTKEFPSNILDALSMDSGVLIRDLNFVDSNNLFNGDSPKAPDTEVQAYTTVDGQAENHVRREHNSHGKHFILHLQVLDQDNSLKFHKPDQKKSSYFIKKKNNKSEHAVSEVVLAYTLRQGSAASDLKPLPDWSKFLEARRFLQHHPMVRLTEDENLDFFLRRNLEYVLSVCSIPVHDADPDGIPAYALTCGDVDSHRVSTAASFYAFQLLLLGLDRFTILHSESEKLPACMCDCDERPSSAPPLLYVCMMKRRIEHVCRGHMKWVFQKAAKPWKPFCPNYWTNGDEIEGWESNAWLPRRSLVDAPFQFIKAADFYRRLKEDMPDKLMEQAKAVYKKWLCHLGEVEKSGKYAFPSYKASGDGKRTKTFYLTDHALIWQAARSAESMKLHVTTKNDSELNEKIDDNNIVELQDEWLYNEPAFFVNATNVEAATVPACLADAVLMINVPEYKSLTKKRNLPTFPIMYFRPGLELWFKIIVSDQREGEAAEKRFWAFASKQAKQNSSCINTFGPNEEVEQAEMTEFFDRHKSSSNFFTEETTAALNIWTTEFHVTFYSGVQEKGLWLGKESEKAAMGFRFEGDFFNKYWTCRFVVADPRLPDKEDTTRDLIRFLQQDNIDDGQTLKEVKTGVWEERRVLELMLFGRIMRKMATSAGHILELAGKIVKEKTEKLEQRLEKFRNSRNPNREQQSPTPDIDYDSFHLTSNEFRKFQAHLQTIHGDFEKARPIRNHWLNREKDRQAEQPQWTFSDESRYRPILNKLLVENHRAIQDLDRNLREISLLAESITKEREYVSSYLEIMANDQSRRNDYDVKLFTNITAVFLPLGFATGMFSMSGTPDAQTVVGMFGLFVGVFILGLLVMIVAKAHARYGSSRQIWEELIRRGQHKIDRAYLLGTSMILILIVAKFYAREVIRRGRQKSNGASLWHGREGSAEGNPTEETNAERKEDVADEVSRRRFCGLKIRRKEESGASARHREGLVEEGRGGIDASTVNETPAAGSAQTFNG